MAFKFSDTNAISGSSTNIMPSETSGGDVGYITWNDFYDWFITNVNSNTDIDANDINVNETNITNLKSLLDDIVGTYQIFDETVGALSLYDFRDHTLGGDFKHEANDITYTPSDGGADTDVSSALDILRGKLQGENSNLSSVRTPVSINISDVTTKTLTADEITTIAGFATSVNDGGYSYSIKPTHIMNLNLYKFSKANNRLDNESLGNGDIQITYDNNNDNYFLDQIYIQNLASAEEYKLVLDLYFKKVAPIGIT